MENSRGRGAALCPQSIFVHQPIAERQTIIAGQITRPLVAVVINEHSILLL
jgi:hypothetical protein